MSVGQNLPRELLGEVLSFSPLSVLEQMGSGIPLPMETRMDLEKRRSWIGSIPVVLVDVLSRKVLLDAPDLAWKPRFMGGTGYIDRILPDDLTSPVMIGLDEHDRRFICLRTFCRQRRESNVVAIFQRYSNDRSTWTMGSRPGPTWVQSSSYLLSRGSGGPLPPWFKKTVSDLMEGKAAQRLMPWSDLTPNCLQFVLR